MDEMYIRAQISARERHQAYVDRYLDPQFEGYVRTIVVRDEALVKVMIEPYGYDDVGVYFAAKYASLGDAIKELEAYLGKPVAEWQDVSGWYPDEQPSSERRGGGGKKIVEAIAQGTVHLPRGGFVLLNREFESVAAKYRSSTL